MDFATRGRSVRRRVGWSVLAATVGLTLMLAGRAAAADGTPATKAPAECAGRVVDLSCDTAVPSGGTVRCDPGEHFFALDPTGPAGLRPLVLDGRSPRVDALRSGALTGREVRIVGACASGGAIVVDDVLPLG